MTDKFKVGDIMIWNSSDPYLVTKVEEGSYYVYGLHWRGTPSILESVRMNKHTIERWGRLQTKLEKALK